MLDLKTLRIQQEQHEKILTRYVDSSLDVIVFRFEIGNRKLEFVVRPCDISVLRKTLAGIMQGMIELVQEHNDRLFDMHCDAEEVEALREIYGVEGKDND